MLMPIARIEPRLYRLSLTLTFLCNIYKSKKKPQKGFYRAPMSPLLFKVILEEIFLKNQRRKCERSGIPIRNHHLYSEPSSSKAGTDGVNTKKCKALYSSTSIRLAYLDHRLGTPNSKTDFVSCRREVSHYSSGSIASLGARLGSTNDRVSPA